MAKKQNIMNFLSSLKEAMGALIEDNFKKISSLDGKVYEIEGTEVAEDAVINEIDEEGNVVSEFKEGEIETEEYIIKVTDNKIVKVEEKEVKEEPVETPVEEVVMSKQERIREAFTLTYDEKYRKIAEAIADPYGYVAEASDEWAVVSHWDEESNEQSFIRYDLVWDGDEVSASNPVEVVSTWVEKEQKEEVVEEVKEEEVVEEAMAEETPAEEKADEAEDAAEEKADEESIESLKERIKSLEDEIAALKDKKEEFSAEPLTQEFEQFSETKKGASKALKYFQ